MQLLSSTDVAPWLRRIATGLLVGGMLLLFNMMLITGFAYAVNEINYNTTCICDDTHLRHTYTIDPGLLVAWAMALIVIESGILFLLYLVNLTVTRYYAPRNHDYVLQMVKDLPDTPKPMDDFDLDKDDSSSL